LSHDRHHEAPKTGQEPPKMPSEGIWEASWSQKPPKRRPDPLQDSILDLQTSIWVPPDLNFGMILHVILLICIPSPPKVLINWRGGTKAQPSSIRRPTGTAC